MKKIILSAVIICLLLTSCQQKKEDFSPDTAEMRGIWISCYDHISAQGKTESEYKTETDEMFELIKNFGFNTAFVHLRAFSDSFYESDIYPYSAYIAGSQGAHLDFDPFAVMLESAEEKGISVHGWINPFRISSDKNADKISEKNPAKKLVESGSDEICILENGIYYNPSCTENHKRITEGIREIVKKYDIDGIHIDDYFYPSVSAQVDSAQYSQYTSQGGKLSLEEWRKENINAFVSALYKAVKTENPNLIFSISPSGRLEENKEKHFADCEMWLSEEGYADMIIPQIYFGFEHETADFTSLLVQWGALRRNKNTDLACGIGAYKCGTFDEYALSGNKEWQEHTDILTRQLACIRANTEYSGFVMFSYGDLTRADCAEEMQKLKVLLRGTDNEKD